MMVLHIGQKIKQVFDDSGMKVQALAEKINYSRQNINGIFKRKSIDTELLLKISSALNYNFFSYYMNETENKSFDEPPTEYKKAQKSEDYSVNITITVNDKKRSDEILKMIGLNKIV